MKQLDYCEVPLDMIQDPHDPKLGIYILLAPIKITSLHSHSKESNGITLLLHGW